MAKLEQDAPPCADCKSTSGTVEIRKRRLCSECVQKFISSKILKRMESYRFKYQDQSQSAAGKRKRLFLPLSGGVSSLVLLQVLDTQVKKQLRQQGRTAYDLVVGHVQIPTASTYEEIHTNKQDEQKQLDWWKNVEEKFNGHEFLSPVSLNDIISYDKQLETDLHCLDIHQIADESDSAFISRVLASPRTSTSRTDLHQILLQRLIIALAKHSGCESIIWGHSDTRLAAKALSEVAKGRGGAVPNGLADGPTQYGLTFNYPLRDLFQSELELYLASLSDKCDDCLQDTKDTETEKPVSIRNTSIDALLATYITSQGEKYPSIMANVVKTASKLQVPTPGEFEPCQFCGMPIISNQQGSEKRSLCHGCERMKMEIRT